MRALRFALCASSCLLAFWPRSAWAEQEPSNSVKEMAREIEARALEYLKTYKPSADAEEVRVRGDGDHLILGFSFSPELRHGAQSEGLLKLQDGQWICFLVWSNHGPRLTNVVYAVDQDGNLYRVRTHVCTRLGLERTGSSDPASAGDLFAMQVVIDDGGNYNGRPPKLENWEKIEAKQSQDERADVPPKAP
jgi:hypothetical protein